MDTLEKKRSSTWTALRWTNCRLRLLPRYLFSGSLKLILQGDSPQADHPLGIIRCYKDPFLWEISFSFTCSLKGISFRNFPAHSRTATNSVGYRPERKRKRDYLFSSYISFWEAGQINWGLGVKGLQLSYFCGARNYLLSKVFSKING